MATFAEYLKALENPFIKTCRLRFLQPDGSTAFALDDNPNQVRNRTFISSGNLTVNLQNGQRRTASISLDNVNGDYDYAYNKLWFGQEIALDEGIVLPSGEIYYIQQGVFLLTNPQEQITPSGRTATYNLVDKWANLDGTLYGILDSDYTVQVGTNIFTAISALLTQSKGNGTVVDNIAPSFTDYYNGKNTTLPGGAVEPVLNAPYDLYINAGQTLDKVVTGLTDMLAAWVGYDAAGALRVEASQDDIDDATKPILWTFSQAQTQLLGLTYSVKNAEVYNDIQIVGDMLDNNSQPMARASNYDPKSDTNINIIGRKTYREERAGYGTQQQCEDYAVWKLKRMSVLQKSVQISCSQILHIKENELVEIVRTDKLNDPIERHLVQGFSRPLTGTGNMTIDAVSVNDFPDMTVTTS
jgi:hypothetical protein